MNREELTVKLRGEDPIELSRPCRELGEAKGWTVQEQRGLDMSTDEPLTRLVYQQTFDDPTAGKRARDELVEAIEAFSTLAIVVP